MKRRDFLIGSAAAGLAATGIPWRVSAEEAARIGERFPAMADTVLGAATALGASFADFHVMQTESESVSAREAMVRDIDANATLGCSVRVLLNGAWGFAAAPDVSESAGVELARAAIAMAKEQNGWQTAPVEIETLPAHVDRWQLPVEIDPFTVPVEEKADRILEITRIAMDKGADYCNASVHQVRERKWLANTFGTRTEQARIRVFPTFSVTVIDSKKGGFASRSSVAPPRAVGYEYMRDYDFDTEAALAVEEAREKMAAPSVPPGPMDLVIHPSNLWLTIHETVGHPTELDRALGFEANYAGTSFCTPDKLGKLQYASDIVTIRGDRTQATGLATVAYDDDGVKTAGNEFNIIERGVFSNYQMALGQAQKIGRKASNGCAYADGFDSFPLQRMPNISLQPGKDDSVTAGDLIAGVEDGIYIVGHASFSIDQQRYNFQFTGQVFHRIRNGKLDGMFKDVAYQGNSVAFWNSCDGLGGAPAYELGGAFNCGKGQPGQAAPVSHGAVPARFRQANILNTAQESGGTAEARRAARNGANVASLGNHCCCSGGGTEWS